MYSQCPECHARFRVSADALRAARGTVRCGRCGSAFNALTWLSDAVPGSPGDANGAPSARDAAHRTASPAPAPVADFHFSADDIEQVFVDVRGWDDRYGAKTQAAEAAESHGDGAEPPEVEVSESQPFEDITLEGERISIESMRGHEAEEDPTDEFEILRDVPDSAYPEDEDEPPVAANRSATTASESGRPDAAALAPATDAEERARPRRLELVPPAVIAPTSPRTPVSPGTGSWTASRPELAADGLEAALERSPRRRQSGLALLAWSVGCLLLALVLLAQVVHQFRQELVRHPQVGPLIRDAYARLGIPLSPNWDLAAFELRQWGNSDSPSASGRLTVRASLTNRAAFAQPHPILRLELDDRYGDSIAVRDFEPAEYLKNPAEASRLLDPGASAEAELAVIDPGQDAVGYQLDVCLRESATILRCAQGPG
jgi:predicted Zn finger-like uncharacterized protein